MNPSKNKGTKAESELVRWARDHGFPHAERVALAGAADSGDVRLTPLGWTAGLVVVEVKAHAVAGRGIPPDALLATWLAEAESERVHARANHCPLVLRRTGSGAGDPGKWWAWLPTWGFTELVEPDRPYRMQADDGGTIPVCLPLEGLTVLLRLAGYGVPVAITQESTR